MAVNTDRKNLLERVTYHAVMRYVQRILGVVVPVPGEMDVQAVASAHCHAAGTTIDDVRAAILEPGIIVAMQNGLSDVYGSDFRARLYQGIIVTVLEREGRLTPRRRLRVLTRREIKAAHQKRHRKARRHQAPRARTLEDVE